jgi:hypothetical protein
VDGFDSFIANGQLIGSEAKAGYKAGSIHSILNQAGAKTSRGAEAKAQTGLSVDDEFDCYLDENRLGHMRDVLVDNGVDCMKRLCLVTRSDLDHVPGLNLGQKLILLEAKNRAPHVAQAAPRESEKQVVELVGAELTNAMSSKDAQAQAADAHVILVCTLATVVVYLHAHPQ